MNIVKFNDVADKIITIRGQKVLLDSDVADLYGTDTRDINKSVKNNPLKFPEGYIIELTETEKAEVVENFHHLEKLKFSPFLPKAFTRKGSYMLATILKGDKATETTMQSRRDDTLLTVGFNLRTTNVAHTNDSPARDDTCFVSVTDNEVSSHAGLKDERSVSLSRRLKSTVNRVSSLRDLSRIICENPRHPRHLRSKILKSSI